MKFDVEGAKKAGYSDTEIVDHLAKESGFDVAGARKSGYADAEILSHLRGPVQQFDKPKETEGFGARLSRELGDVPRQLGLTARAGLEGLGSTVGVFSDPIAVGVNALAGKKAVPTGAQTGKNVSDLLGLPVPQTMTEKVVAEPAKLMAGGAGLIGGARAVASQASPAAAKIAEMLASNPALQMQSAAGAGLAGGYAKETGGDGLAQGGAALAGGLAAPGLVGLTKNIPQMARSGIEFLAPGIAKPQMAPQVDVIINGLLKNSGLKMGDVSASALSALRNDVSTALKTGGQLSPDALRRLADYRMVGATPTRAGITLDPADVSRQKNTAKFGINSSDPKLQQLGQIENANNRTLIEGLNTLGANTADDAIGGASKVMGTLSGLDRASKSAINSAYENARSTAGRSAALDPSRFSQSANNLLDEALLGGKLPSDVRNLLNKAATGEMPLTVDVSEQFKTRIGELQRASSDAAERKALGLVRQALDDTPLLEGQGQGAIDAFNKARALNRQYMSVVERVPALQAVRDGIEPDKFVNQFILGSGKEASVMDVAKLKHLVKGSPEAMNAIRGQMLAHLKSKALNGNTDEIGSFSQSAFNKAIGNIGERKLKLFFNKAEIEQIKAIGRVASYEQVQPRGSAVNNSNTAGAAMSMLFEKLANSPIVSKIPMGPQIAGNLSASLGARRALNAPAAIVAPKEAGDGVAPYLLPAVAATGLLTP